MADFSRTPDELHENAVRYWPPGLRAKESEASVIPRLIETQDKFIGILHVADSAPDAWKTVLTATRDLPPNVFLKHLMVLADVGGEKLMRLRSDLKRLFLNGRFEYLWRGNQFSYAFKRILNCSRLTNKTLYVDGRSILQARPLDEAMEDVIMLLMFGDAAITTKLPDEIASKCGIGGLLGRKKELNDFVKQRYIWVSRITGGASANTLGQLAQDYVLSGLKERLPSWTFTRNGTIPGISQTGGKTETTFDIVAQSPNNRYVAIEASFQVTTNSVIERKAGQALSRRVLLHGAGHKIAYVIDGAGNFERRAALTTICENGDCTVALSDSELSKLADFCVDFSGSMR